MLSGAVSVSEGEKRILITIKEELLPCLDKVRQVLVNIHKYRVSFHLYSTKVKLLEVEYQEVSAKFFEIVRKLQTPDILFKGLNDGPSVMTQYVRFHDAFEKNIAEGITYVEIIDRTLDRKNQIINNNRILLVSVVAVFIAVFSLFSQGH